MNDGYRYTVIIERVNEGPHQPATDEIENVVKVEVSPDGSLTIHGTGTGRKLGPTLWESVEIKVARR